MSDSLGTAALDTLLAPYAGRGREALLPVLWDVQTEAGRLKVIGLYDQVRVRYLDEDEWGPLDPTGRALGNINTPEELAAATQSMIDEHC